MSCQEAYHDHIVILGIKVSNLTKAQVIDLIKQYLGDNGQHYLVTTNPEFILAAKQDEEFFYIINNADISVPDGFGLKIASWWLGKNICRYPGADLMHDILKMAETGGHRVGFVHWQGSHSRPDEVSQAVKKIYPKLQFTVSEIDRDPEIFPKLALTQFGPAIIFVSLGAPWQEKWIYHQLKNISTAGVAIGIGGALDYLTGAVRRAPKIMRILGIEWLWRLLKQPWRWRRIYNAVVVFPWKFFKWRFVNPWQYRPNVSCLLYRKAGDRYEILVVERANQAGHWQLPQGGTDGLPVEKAGLKELREELNCDKIKLMKSFSNLRQYEFGKGGGKFGVRAREGWGYRGQKQSLVIAEFFGRDSDIKINFWEHSAWKWVDSEKLVEAVFPSRREAVNLYLHKFNELLENRKQKTENRNANALFPS